jgi:copper chaperone CopZ
MNSRSRRNPNLQMDDLSWSQSLFDTFQQTPPVAPVAPPPLGACDCASPGCCAPQLPAHAPSPPATLPTTETRLHIQHLCCSGELPLINSALAALPGVLQVSVDVPGKTATVLHDTDLVAASQLALVLNQAELGAKVLSSSSHLHGRECGHIAVAHSGSDGRTHLGFLINGQLKCYATPEKVGEEVCFETAKGLPLAAHPRGPQCGQVSSCWDASEVRYPLVESEPNVDCLTPLLACSELQPRPSRPLRAMSAAAAATAAAAAAAASDGARHLHGAACGHPTVRHGDHMDFLVGDDEGNLLLQSPAHDGPQQQHRVFAKESQAWGGNLFVAGIGMHYLGWMRHSLAGEDELWPGSSAGPEETELAVHGMCCSSETALIHKLLRSVPGVVHVRVHQGDKRVVVQHYASECSALDLTAALNREHLDAHVTCTTAAATSAASPTAAATAATVHPAKCAVAADEQPQALAALPFAGASALPPPPPGNVRSVLSVQGVCCRSEVPSVQAICAAFSGVSGAQVNVVKKQIILVHAPAQSLASDVAKQLTTNGFTSRVLVDGDDDGTGCRLGSSCWPRCCGWRRGSRT